jgi:16S rRNA (cytosine1402-N4)-methyltransferase
VSDSPSAPSPQNPNQPRKRRPRYSGKYPRRFEEKYKEHHPERYSETVQKVIASGKTPAGTHRPIMVKEILEILAPVPGERALDCTLGYGGHAQEILARLLPGGMLIGLDADPLELPKTESRLRQMGYGPESFVARRSNFAGLSRVLGELGISGVDMVLADLGVSSMQLDQPLRGFSVKLDGPLDMRMNPGRGISAAELLARSEPETLARLLVDNADEPRAELLSVKLAGAKLATTMELSRYIRSVVARLDSAEADLTVRRVFQALRIAVNDEFGALDAMLKQMPHCLAPKGRVAVLTFHSGEDRRVKKSFAAGLANGVYNAISEEVMRPSPDEQRSNPRSSPAKLRWARRA